MRGIPSPELGVFNRDDVCRFYHKVTTSTSGTIASQDAVVASGIQATKTATKTGRYTLTINSGETFSAVLFVNAVVIGPDDAAYGANTTGFKAFLRTNDISGGNLDGTIEVQFVQTSYADAEVPDSAIILFEVVLQRGKVRS